MKKIFLLLLPILFMVSCTQNDGDISPWFGNWRLTSVEADGEPVEEYKGNMTWAFQNDIICLTTVTGPQTADYVWGRWSECGAEMILSFDNHDDNNGTVIYEPPVWLGFSISEPNRLEIQRSNGREAVMTLTDADGKVFTYKLKKVY